MTGVLESIQRLSRPERSNYPHPAHLPSLLDGHQDARAPDDRGSLNDAYRLDLDAIEAAFVEAAKTGGTPLLLLSNPHNPSGTVNTREELEAVAALARKHGARVVADEIHAPLIMPTSTFTPYLSVAGTEPDVSMTSASKGWNLAGFKAAIVIGGSDAGEDLQSINHRMGTHPGHIAVIAHSTAYDQGRPWLDGAIAGIDTNRRLLAELLQEYLPQCALYPAGKHLPGLDRLS